MDAVRERGVDPATLERVFARLSFFVNAGMRFVEELCKLRAFGQLWRRLGRERYGIDNEESAALSLWRPS